MKTTTETLSPESTRKVGFGLLIGIVLCPLVFALFLLRRGYSTQARIFGYSWFAIMLCSVISSPLNNNKKANTVQSYNDPSVKPSNQMVEVADKSASQLTRESIDVKPTKPIPDFTYKNFLIKCGENVDHSLFEQSCKGKTVLLKGVITNADSDQDVKIDFGDKTSWNAKLDKTSPRYKKGTKVQFSATIEDQMGWGANLINTHYWSRLGEVVDDAEKLKKSVADYRQLTHDIETLCQESVKEKLGIVGGVNWSDRADKWDMDYENILWINSNNFTYDNAGSTDYATYVCRVDASKLQSGGELTVRSINITND
jgi:hypothetical protein